VIVALLSSAICVEYRSKSLRKQQLVNLREILFIERLLDLIFVDRRRSLEAIGHAIAKIYLFCR
jgi:hypothetical protein